MALLLLAGSALPARPQWAAGLFGGVSQDMVWRFEMAHAGVQLEWRPKFLHAGTLRAGAWLAPMRANYREEYRSVSDPGVHTWLAETITERHAAAGAAIDVRFPFEHNDCTNGYYKGSYLVAGAGFIRRWQAVERWRQDQYGTMSTFSNEHAFAEPVARAGVGGELNYGWGGLFLEALFTVSVPAEGTMPLRIPDALVVNLGYRYTFAARRAVQPAEDPSPRPFH